MTISWKLKWFLVGVVTVFVGLAVATAQQLRTVSSGYDAVLAGPVLQADAARVTQVEFKKQVQEWKDVLLRGHKAADLEKYTKQFRDRETAVRTQAQALSQTVTDATARQLLKQFVTAHQEMSVKYWAAYDVFIANGFDAKMADTMVRGQDRAPTDLFDKVVGTLEAGVKASVAAQQVATARSRNLSLALGGLVLGTICIAGFVVVSGVVRRLAKLKAVSDRLAKAEVDGLSIDISGHDEVGAFGESLKGVKAAIEELSTLAVGAVDSPSRVA